MKELAFLASRDEDTNYDGVEMMINWRRGYIGKRRTVLDRGKGQKKV